MNGIARDFILTDLKLYDGVTYYVTLVSCNGAQLCSSSTSSGILVDSSPPNRGIYPTVVWMIQHNLVRFLLNFFFFTF